MSTLAPDRTDPQVLAASSPAGFAHVCSQGLWVPYEHLVVLNDHLLQLVDGRIDRLMVTMPPQHGKSELISKWFPAWYLGTFPTEKVLLGSYQANYAHSWGRRARETLTEFGPEIFGVHVAEEPRRQDWWFTDQDGYMASDGREGSFTGKSAHLIIIDDPIKGHEDARSEVEREKLWNWWVETLSTRLQKKNAVVVVQCMTGDTPVLMGDGTERPLRIVRPGDTVATYENGTITAAKVRNWANQGSDTIYTIRMRSGRTVRANARHPFLTVDAQGVESWQRTDTLRPGSRILAVTGASGAGLPAPPRAATSPRNARACACRTTTNSDGRTGSEPPRSIPQHAGKRTSVIATGSARPTMTGCSQSRVGSAPSANKHRPRRTREPTGTASSASITAMTQDESAACCATTATSSSATAEQKKTFGPPPITYAIERDEVADVAPCGVEDVYDLQVARTENFIANGLVSHNTRWHEDDLAGRLLANEGEEWTVLNLPALAEEGDALGRAEGEPLCPELHPMHKLERQRRKGAYAWAALYQQRPAPLEGFLFKRSDFRYWRTDTKWIGSAEQQLYVLADDDGPRVFDVPATPRFQVVDAAISEKEMSDYTVCATWALTEQGDLILLDLERHHFEEAQVIQFLAAQNDKHGRLPMWIEQFGAGRNPLARLRAGGRPVMEIPAEAGARADKMTRAIGAMALCQAHKLFFPANRPDWLSDYEHELVSFPNATHDDMVDVTAYAARLVPIFYGEEIRPQRTDGPRPHTSGVRREQF